MQVGDKVYCGETVADGMFDSLNTHKAPCMDEYSNLAPYNEAVETYKHIIQLAANGGKIPLVTLMQGEKLLLGLKSSDMAWFSITSLHFLH